VKGLADRIRLLLDDPALADRLGQNGRGMALERFDSQRMTLDIVRIYQDVVADARTRPTAHSLATIGPA
jgi:glycosyltransferase involved in cell wall biosynthesis